MVRSLPKNLEVEGYDVVDLEMRKRFSTRDRVRVYDVMHIPQIAIVSDIKIRIVENIESNDLFFKMGGTHESPMTWGIYSSFLYIDLDLH